MIGNMLLGIGWKWEGLTTAPKFFQPKTYLASSSSIYLSFVSLFFEPFLAMVTIIILRNRRVITREDEWTHLAKLIWLSSCFCLATLQGDVFQGIYNAPSPGIQNVKDNVDIFGLSLVSGWWGYKSPAATERRLEGGGRRGKEDLPNPNQQRWHL